MRNTKVPFVCLAWAQLNSAVRISPTCGVPVGEGQKRTRTGVSAGTEGREAAGDAEAVVIVASTLPPAARGLGGPGSAADYGVGQPADSFDFHLKAVAGVNQADPGRGAGHDDVA